jgi:hypothetical protein
MALDKDDKQIFGAVGLIVLVVWLLNTLLSVSSSPSYTPSVSRGGDLDCADIGHSVVIRGADPNGLDGDGDGVGCEGW